MAGRSGTVYENWLAERGEVFRAGVRIATLDPFWGQQECHRLACFKDATSVLDAFHIVKLAGDAQLRYAALSSKTLWATLKIKYYYRRTVITCDEIYTGVVTWIEHFYNRRCTDASLGGKSSIEYELHQAT